MSPATLGIHRISLAEVFSADATCFTSTTARGGGGLRCLWGGHGTKVLGLPATTTRSKVKRRKMEARILNAKALDSGPSLNNVILLRVDGVTAMFVLTKSLNFYAIEGTPVARRRLSRLWTQFIARTVHIPDEPWPRRIVVEFAKWLRRR